MTSSWWWRSLRGPDSISWPVLLIPVVITIPTTVLNARSWNMTAGISALGQAAGLTLLLSTLIIARYTWLQPNRQSRSGSLIVLVTFATASCMRLVGMGLVFGASGDFDQWPIVVSAISGGVGQTIILCIGAIATNTLRAHARTMMRLDGVLNQIERVRSLTLEDIQRMQREVADEVLTSARALLASADSDAQKLIDAVNRSATEVVRPASHDLHSGQSLADRLQDVDQPTRIRSVLRNIRPLAPVVGPVMYELLVLGAVWGSQGPPVALVNLAAATPLLVAGNLLLRKWWEARHRNRWLVIQLFGAYLIVNLVAIAAIIALTAAMGYNTTDLVVGVGLYPMAMVIGSILFDVVQQQAEVERSLARAVEDETLAMSQTLRLAEDERRRLARVMHGEVQAELTAASARLAALPSTDEQAAAQVVEELSARLDAIDITGSPAQRQKLDDLWDTWRLAIALDVDITPQAQNLLDEQPETQERLVPIVSEAITNAVRHGSDDEVTVDLDVQDSMVQVEIRNRGTLAVGPSGLGTTEIDQYTETWTVSQDGPEVVFTATVRPQSWVD